MVVLVLVLAVLLVTNIVTLGVVASRRVGTTAAPDALAAQALDATPRPPHPVGVTRRLISIEILNPIELAGSRGRIAGLAGSLAPRLTRLIVYEQTLRILKAQLEAQHVVADVRLHTVRPVDAHAVDAVETVDLDAVEDPPSVD